MSQKFRNWDERYQGDEYLFGTEPNDFLRSVADRLPPAARVLCLADGEGRNGVYLATLGHQVTSIDQSAVGLEKARSLASTHGVKIEPVTADLTQHDLGENEWDGIVSIFFHISPELRAMIYPRVVRALKPGGMLILESYRPEQLTYGTGGPPVADHMLTEEIVTAAFSELEITHLESVERDVIEGSGHTGKAAVLQLIAIKTRE